MLGKSTSTVKCLKIKLIHLFNLFVCHTCDTIFFCETFLFLIESFSFKAIDPCHFCNLLFSFLEQKRNEEITDTLLCSQPICACMPFPLFSEKGINAKKEALRKAEQLTVRLRTRRSHILRWAVGALDWYHSIWFLNCSLDDYFNRADCDPDLLPALRAFGEPLRTVCLLRSEQAQAAKVCMLGGVEKPSSLADWTSDRPICFHCTIYC